MTGPNRTILLVDDDALIRRTFEFAFKAAGYAVLLAENGRKALDLLGRHQVDIAILDVFMPDQDGIETLLAIKRQFPDIDVYVMSGGGVRGHYEFLQIALKLGADGIVRKPMAPAQLIALIEGVSLSKTSGVADSASFPAGTP